MTTCPSSAGGPLAAIARQATHAMKQHWNEDPLWTGPWGDTHQGGVTQSLIARFLSCRERFRLKYLLGLEPMDRWNHRLGYGTMWHICEEALAAEHRHFGDEHDGTVMTNLWREDLLNHSLEMTGKYPLQAEEITKWYNVCLIQFPEYVKYWREHADVQYRIPMMQEYAFDVPYALPSGRVIRLRGKFDSVDLIEGKLYLQENKTKGDVDELQIGRQLKFDLQTMLYLVALDEINKWNRSVIKTEHKIGGVRYNVIRRPLSGGRGNIRPHAAKSTKTKYTPAEGMDEFYERLRRDYIAADPGYWFMRIRAEVSAQDIEIFKQTCLDPILENLCFYYEQLTNRTYPDKCVPYSTQPVPANYRTPFGMWSALEEGGATEYDAYMDEGIESGLTRVKSLFPELLPAKK